MDKGRGICMFYQKAVEYVLSPRETSVFVEKQCLYSWYCSDGQLNF